MSSLKEFFSGLTWVDYVSLLALLRGAWVGYRSGFFAELLRIVHYLACVAAAVLLSPALGEYLTLKTFFNAETALAIAFVGILIASFLAGLLIRIVTVKLLKASAGGVPSRLLGVLVGMTRWVFVLSFLFFVIERSPLDQLKSDIHTRSYAGEHISKLAPALYDYLTQLTAKVEDLKVPEAAGKTP